MFILLARKGFATKICPTTVRVLNLTVLYCAASVCKTEHNCMHYKKNRHIDCKFNRTIAKDIQCSHFHHTLIHIRKKKKAKII